MKVSKYKGEFIYHRKVAEKCLAMIQADWESHLAGTAQFRCEKYTGKGWTNVLEFYEEWMHEVIEPNLSPATIKGYWSYYRNWFVPFFTKFPIMLHEIRLHNLTQLMNFVTLAPKTKYNVINAFHSFLDYAHRSDRIPEMPPFPEKKKYKLTDPDFNWLDEETQLRVIYAIPDIHQPVFLWLKHHYRRSAEACALQWRDWDDLNQVFKIRRSISARQIVPSTKTGAIHYQPCDPDFLPIIKRLRQEHLDRGGDFNEYIFQNPRARRKGRRYTNESLNVLWREACKKEGVSISLFEGLKHSSCSQFVNEKEGTVDELQMLTDHARRDSVLKYAKVGVGRKLALMKKRKLKIVSTADLPQDSKEGKKGK